MLLTATRVSNESKNVKAGDIVDKRNIIYYSNVNAESTRKLMQKTISLKEMVAEGWNGVIATDPDGASYMLLSNFCGDTRCQLKNVQLNGAAPVFTVETNIVDSKADATFLLDTILWIPRQMPPSSWIPIIPRGKS